MSVAGNGPPHEIRLGHSRPSHAIYFFFLAFFAFFAFFAMVFPSWLRGAGGQ